MLCYTPLTRDKKAHEHPQTHLMSVVTIGIHSQVKLLFTLPFFYWMGSDGNMTPRWTCSFLPIIQCDAVTSANVKDVVT